MMTVTMMAMLILGAVGLVLVLRLRAIQLGFGPLEPPPLTRQPEPPRKLEVHEVPSPPPRQIEAPPRQLEALRQLEPPRQARVGPSETRAGQKAKGKHSTKKKQT